MSGAAKGEESASRPSGKRLFLSALKYSFPVFLGYITIGIAFGLFTADAGYPWWIAVLTSLVIYAGAGQFIAVGLFAAGAGLAECMLIELVVNARHMAYGLTMLKRFKNARPYKWYLIFALSDETFALLSSLPEEQSAPRFLFLVSILNQGYWVAGTLIGALAGSLIPFDTEGVGFALTALFVVLMIEQMRRVKNPLVFISSAAAAVLGVIFLPPRLALLGAMIASLIFLGMVDMRGGKNEGTA
ncbi:MAG: AzlC family ABC transporter permease [Treponema sp.]|jgi:4-azaleucine resistance transporter AzlC|nr:AzlC family ABC transporter permease [Treponema sp.]